MTDKLTKTFFDTFGIEPITGCKHIWNGGTRESIITCIERCENYSKREECKRFITIYPQITDRILLELICIHNQYSHPFSIYGEKKEFLKNDILECMINILNYFYEHEMGEYSELKHQVRTLFEEG